MIWGVKSGRRLHSSAKCQGSNEKCLGAIQRRAALLILSPYNKPSKRPLGWSEWPDVEIQRNSSLWVMQSRKLWKHIPHQIETCKTNNHESHLCSVTIGHINAGFCSFVFIYNLQSLKYLIINNNICIYLHMFAYVCIFVLLNFCPSALFKKLAASLLLYSFLLGSMKGGYIRVEVDEWGKVSAAENPEVGRQLLVV